jgi:WD40 repeat protein
VDGVWAPRSSLIGHWAHGECHSARFRPDGYEVASVNVGGTLSVWDVRSGTVIKVLERHSPIYHAIACDAAGKSIVSSGAFSEVAWVWRVAEGTLQRVLRAPAAANGSIGGVTFSPDGTEIAVGFVDRLWSTHVSHSVGLWNAGDNSPVRLLDGAADAPNIAMAYSPDGRKIAAGSWDQLRVWDKVTGNALYQLDGMTGAIAFRPDGRRLIAVGEHMIRFVDSDTGSVGPVIAPKLGEAVRGAVYDNKGRRIITAETPGVRIRDESTGEIVRDITLFNALSVAISPDGLLLAASNWHGDITVREYETGEPRWKLRAHNAGNRGLCFIPHSHLLAAGGGEGTLRFWDMRTGAQARVMLLLGDDRTAVIAPDGDLIASDPAALDELVYLVQEKKDGPVKCLTPGEFRARWGKAVGVSARTPSGPGGSPVK